MDINLLFKGALLGFSIAAPVGPIGLLCIRRTLAEGPTSGFVSGLGAATADALYGCIAGFGLTVITNMIVSGQGALRFIGGLFLCYLGIRTFLTAPAEKAASAKSRNLLGGYISTFFLTITNPLTILSFAAMFAGLGLAGESRSYTSTTLMVSGVLIGSALWWFTLCGVVGLFRTSINEERMKWVNRVAGVIIIVFGGASLIALVN